MVLVVVGVEVILELDAAAASSNRAIMECPTLPPESYTLLQGCQLWTRPAQHYYLKSRVASQCAEDHQRAKKNN